MNPIALLLGAGASFPYGIPMMRGFYKEFATHVRKRHSKCAPLLTALEEKHAAGEVDLETLIADLQYVLGASVGLELLGHVEPRIEKEIEIARELRGYLDAFIVDCCERFDREKASREIPALLGLAGAGPLWLFTTNYDRIIETVCESTGVSWSDGFESSVPTPVADWKNSFDQSVRIVKLHGSVNWYEDDPGGALHRLDRGYSLPGYEFRLLRGDKRFRPLMIIPTLEKEALGDPYIGLSVRFTDVLIDTRLLIIVGNSLRDRHIKAYIQQRIDKLRVLLVSPNASSNVNLLGRPDRTHTLDSGVSELLVLGKESLQRLQQELMNATEDGSVHAAVQRFIDRVSVDVSDAKTIATDPELARAWTDLDNSSAPMRVAALKLLARRTHPAVRRKIEETARTDGSEHVRVAAIDALVALAGPGATEAIGQILCSDASTDVQLEAALALTRPEISSAARPWIDRRINGPPLTPTLRAILAGQDSQP